MLDRSGEMLPGFPTGGFLLAAFLAGCPETHASRFELWNLFWSDVSTAKAQANLRQVLALVRKFESRHGLQILKSDANTIRLASPDQVDVLGLISRFDQLPTSEIVAYFRLDNATLLHGTLSKSPKVQAWLDGERRSTQQRLVELALSAANTRPSLDKVQIYSALTGVEPYDENIFGLYVAALAETGDRPRIAVEWEHFRDRLRAELNIDPSAETLALLETCLGPRAVAQAGGASSNALQLADLGHFAPMDGHRPRLLVLPPAASDLARPAEQSMVRGFVEDIVDRLATLRSFDVIAPHSARQVAQSPELTDRLGQLDYIFSCRFSSGHGAGEAGELTVRLTDQSSGQVVFADRFLLAADTLPQRYSDMLLATTSGVISEVERSELSNFRTSGVASAYVFYLLAKDKIRPFDLRSVRASKRSFQKSLHLDPGFIPAKSLLSRTLTQEWFLLARPDKDLLENSRDLAMEVINEAPLYAGGYWERSNALLYLGDIDGAVESAETARQLAPHDADLLMTHADMLVHACEFRRARDEMARAMALNPLAPDDYHWILATAQFLSGDHEAALDSLRRTTDWQVTARLRSVCHALMGNRGKAKFWRQRFLEEYPDFSVGNWQQVVPMKSPEVREYYTDALKLAGFV